jgi:hypothetical protein
VAVLWNREEQLFWSNEAFSAPEGGTTDPAEARQQDGLAEELDADVSPGGTQSPAKADVGASLQDSDDHGVGHPDPAHEQGHSTEREQQRDQRLVGSRLRGQRLRGPTDGDLLRVLWVDGGRQDGADVLDLRLWGAFVQPGRSAVLRGPFDDEIVLDRTRRELERDLLAGGDK